MDKRTLLAVALSVIIIVGGMIIQPILFPSKTALETQSTTPTAQLPAGTSAKAPAASSPAVVGTGKVVAAPAVQGGPRAGEIFVRETDLYGLTFLSDGGVLSSIQLKKFKNVDGSPVEMAFLSKGGEYPFGLSFGDYKTEQESAPFALRESRDSSRSTFEFSKSYLSPTGRPFTLRKTYVFFNGEYLFELRIAIEDSGNEIPDLNFGGLAYSLTIGPQIGPSFKKLDGRNDFRSYAYYADAKRQDPKAGAGTVKEIDGHMTWAAIVGKYFTVIAVPDATQYKVVFDSRKLGDGFTRSSLSFQRPALNAAKTVDAFKFYVGPMKKDILARYNDTGKNGAGVAGLHADEVVTTSILIGWLAQLLKWALEFFYLLIPNYGIAIILLTLFTKALFLPLTFKSSEATARMQALNPKMAEIRERLKGKPEKMNQEIAGLYKKEKVNPLSGCLPLLLQLPIFFALYNLLSSHFELRGALFIPGWIPDLSAPESVLDFGFAVPLVGWTSLRLLPLLMVATQLVQSKFTQPADATQSGAQMKLFTYAMPIVFLFILYDMPSGLVLYWTVQNLLSVAQQLYINWWKKRKDAIRRAAAAGK